MHWIQEKPEDISWCHDILELRHRVFRYLLITFRQTELARNLWNISVKHEELERSYKCFVGTQKQDWPLFRDIVLSYSRPTDCDLVGGGFSETNIDDLTKYMACMVSRSLGFMDLNSLLISRQDLILFRDGSEISTLDQYWKEQIYNETCRRYDTNNCFYEKPVKWWGVADRVKRFLLRSEMVCKNFAAPFTSLLTTTCISGQTLGSVGNLATSNSRRED